MLLENIIDITILVKIAQTSNFINLFKDTNKQ